MIDLNLLRIVLAVHDAGSVAGAAKALDMSQPGLSTALQRARTALNDPLFLRGTKGMEPTARTKAIVSSIRAILESVDKDIVSVASFDPATYSGEFRLALTDAGEATLLPTAVRFLTRECPHATVRSVRATIPLLENMMEEGQVDLALGCFPDLSSANYHEQVLFSSGFCCIVAANHPIRGDRITLEQFCAFGHVVAEFPARSHEIVDEFIRRNKIERQVVLTTQHFMSIPAIVSQTRLIATVPEGIVAWTSSGQNYRVLLPDFTLPRFESKVLWHGSLHHDARNIWLRRSLHKELHAARWIEFTQPQPNLAA